MWLYDLLFSLDVKAILLFIVFFLLVANFLKNRNAENYPPGPLALPLVVFSDMKNKPYVQMYSTIWHFLCFMQCPQLTKAYGNVFSIRFGRDKMVFVCGYKMVKEAIVTQAENFVDRPYSETLSPSLPFSYSAFCPVDLTERYTEELTLIPTSLHISKLFNNAVSNIICQLVMGRRFDYSDHNFQILLKYLSGAMQLEGSIWGLLYEAFPGVMKHLPGPHNKIFSYYKYLEGFISQEIQRHKKDLDPNNPRDYIDTFILEMHNSNLGFSEANLALCSLDLFVAGTETTSTTLLWALTFLIKNPDVQEKVQAEIDRVIGQTRQPTMADRPNMPYTDAVIHEIQRMGNIVPLNGLRMAAKDTTLGGYFIPKGTALMPMLTSVLFDKNEWETPDTFNPRHFLDAEGKFVRREAFLPFSAGKRVCLGEGLARMELFLFFVSLFQKFTFSTLDGVELDTEGVIGTTHVPKPFKVYAKAR
uniref:Cytochrome P450, family 2, subfamily N, polypeptide 13 n=1 Tax=Myripristis murdjan TaxID=586833 RepID=A0A667WJB9_9TELE